MHTAKTLPFSHDDGGDAVDLLRRQHREIDQLLGALVAASAAGEKRRLLAEVGDLLAVHMAIEERIFYPGLTPAHDDASGSFVVLAVEDHFGPKRRLAELLQTAVEDESFDRAARTLKVELATHISAEERLFPRIRRRLPRARLRRLEYEMRVLEFQIRTDAAPRRLVVEDGAAVATA